AASTHAACTLASGAPPILPRCTPSAPSTSARVTIGPRSSWNAKWSKPVSDALLTLDHVSQVFKTRQGSVRAVDDVSLDVEPGQVVCLVGESGSGKTTTAKIAAGLRRPTGGAVNFRGQDVWRMNRDQFRIYRQAV